MTPSLVTDIIPSLPYVKPQILNSIVKDIFLTREEEGKAIWQFNVSSTLQVGSIQSVIDFKHNL